MSQNRPSQRMMALGVTFLLLAGTFFTINGNAQRQLVGQVQENPESPCKEFEEKTFQPLSEIFDEISAREQQELASINARWDARIEEEERKNEEYAQEKNAEIAKLEKRIEEIEKKVIEREKEIREQINTTYESFRQEMQQKKEEALAYWQRVQDAKDTRVLETSELLDAIEETIESIRRQAREQHSEREQQAQNASEETREILDELMHVEQEITTVRTLLEENSMERLQDAADSKPLVNEFVFSKRHQKLMAEVDLGGNDGFIRSIEELWQERDHNLRIAEMEIEILRLQIWTLEQQIENNLRNSQIAILDMDTKKRVLEILWATIDFQVERDEQAANQLWAWIKNQHDLKECTLRLTLEELLERRAALLRQLGMQDDSLEEMRQMMEQGSRMQEEMEQEERRMQEEMEQGSRMQEEMEQEERRMQEEMEQEERRMQEEMEQGSRMQEEMEQEERRMQEEMEQEERRMQEEMEQEERRMQEEMEQEERRMQEEMEQEERRMEEEMRQLEEEMRQSAMEDEMRQLEEEMRMEEEMRQLNDTMMDETMDQPADTKTNDGGFFHMFNDWFNF